MWILRLNPPLCNWSHPSHSPSPSGAGRMLPSRTLPVYVQQNTLKEFSIFIVANISSFSFFDPLQAGFPVLYSAGTTCPGYPWLPCHRNSNTCWMNEWMNSLMVRFSQQKSHTCVHVHKQTHTHTHRGQGGEGGREKDGERTLSGPRSCKAWLGLKSVSGLFYFKSRVWVRLSSVT